MPYEHEIILWRTRRQMILEDREKGLTLHELGKKWKISRERARQLITIAKRERENG